MFSSPININETITTTPNTSQIPPSDINLMDSKISPRERQKHDDAKELDQDNETEERGEEEEDDVDYKAERKVVVMMN